MVSTADCGPGLPVEEQARGGEVLGCGESCAGLMISGKFSCGLEWFCWIWIWILGRGAVELDSTLGACAWGLVLMYVYKIKICCTSFLL